MNYWTIQPIEQLQNLKKNGFIVCNSELAMASDPYFKQAYDWMSEQMRLRLNEKFLHLKYPLWCWHSRYNFTKRKPDFRNSEYRQLKGSIVRIEFEIPDNQILLSDFELWHSVFYQCYIADDENDYKIFENYLDENYPGKKLAQLPQELRNKIIKSWEKIFDLDFHDPYIAHKRQDKSIQGTF